MFLYLISLPFLLDKQHHNVLCHSVDVSGNIANMMTEIVLETHSADYHLTLGVYSQLMEVPLTSSLFALLTRARLTGTAPPACSAIQQ